MSQRGFDQDPDEDQFDVRGNKPRGGRGKKMRRREEEGDDRKGGRRGNRKGDPTYSTGPEPEMTAMEQALREGGVHIPTPEDLAREAEGKSPAAEVTPLATVASAPVTVAVAPAPTTQKTVSAGPTPELSKVTHKEETIMTARLPDLPNLDVNPLTDEDIRKAEQEAAGRRVWAETAGKTLAQLKTDKATIEGNPDFAMSPTLKARHEAIIKKIAEIEGVQDEGVRKHAEFSELLNAIQSGSTNQVNDLVNRALNAGRIKEVQGARGPKVLYWHGGSYVATSGTGGTDAIILELIKLAEKAKAENRKRWNDGVAAMKEKGSGLTLLAVGEGGPNDPAPVGFVYVHLPRTETMDRTDPTKKFTVAESHLLVEVAKIEGKGRDGNPFTQFVIRPIQAMGGRKREELFDALVKSKAFLSVWDFRRGNLPRSLQEKIPAQAYENLFRFMRLLRAALEIERAAAQKAVEAATAKTAAPAVVPAEVAPAPVVAAEPTVTDPPAAAPEATTGDGTDEGPTPAASS